MDLNLLSKLSSDLVGLYNYCLDINSDYKDDPMRRFRKKTKISYLKEWAENFLEFKETNKVKQKDLFQSNKK